eukprot:m.449775 g.449775  ORF g.449775 m.449775 type:complete len:175 (-) comp19873_c0_seq1:78-602(-)
MAEVREAAKLLTRLVRAQLDETTRGTLNEELIKRLEQRIHGHWYPHAPERGSAHRCVLISSGKVDSVVLGALIAARVVRNEEEARGVMPSELAVWVDPGDVAVRLGNEQVWSVTPTAATQAGDLRPVADVQAFPNFMASATTMSATAPSFCPSTLMAHRHGGQTTPTAPFIMAR